MDAKLEVREGSTAEAQAICQAVCGSQVCGADSPEAEVEA